jgi:3-deoxy-D-manno-octulosonic-acid transferase
LGLSSAVLLVYDVGYALYLLLSIPVQIVRGKARGYLHTLPERLGRRLPAPGEGPLVWIHAVSVGEVLAARSLVAPLREALPGARVALSTTTLTGHAIARKGLTADVLLFAPFDLRFAVRRVVGALRPRLLLLVETELWPNLVREARQAGARVAVVNGRLSDRSFPRYRRIRGLLRPLLAQIDLFLMQGPEHAERMLELGAEPSRVRVGGNLKFDALEAAEPPETLRLLLDTQGAPLLIAGSTMPGEEALVLQAFRVARARVPALRLVLVPRHPERFGAVTELVAAAGFPCVRRSALRAGEWRDEVMVLDTMGELAKVYPLATVVFVGGSLVPKGGHNVLEPAVAGRPVVVGPHMENFREIAELFLAAGAIVQVGSAADLGEQLILLLEDEPRRQAIGERARLLVEQQKGAVRRSVEALRALCA